jgi:phage terminase large subunit
VIMLRRGPVSRCVWARVGEDTMRTTGEVIKALRTHHAGIAKVDDVGVGGGVVDRLREQRHPAVGLNGGHRPKDRRRFVNARAEWYWELRERFEHGEIDIDPEDEVLAEQLCSIRYGVDSAGRIQIESKEDMRARGIASPDRADALALAFAEVELRARARVSQAVIIP